MSRNLDRADCHFCAGVVRRTSPPRPAGERDVGAYLDQYEGMIVADAECVDWACHEHVEEEEAR